MKTPEQFLQEWMLDQIEFYAGGNGHFWSRDELAGLAAYLSHRENPSGGLTQVGVRTQFISVPWDRIDWELARQVRSMMSGLSAMIKVQSLARFGSLQEFHIRLKHQETFKDMRELGFVE